MELIEKLLELGFEENSSGTYDLYLSCEKGFEKYITASLYENIQYVSISEIELRSYGEHDMVYLFEGKLTVEYLEDLVRLLKL